MLEHAGPASRLGRIECCRTLLQIAPSAIRPDGVHDLSVGHRLGEEATGGDGVPLA